MSVTAIVANPLVSSRIENPGLIPQNVRRGLRIEQHANGQFYAITDRDSVVNSENTVASIFPGDFTYTPDSTIEIELSMWENDPQSIMSSSIWIKMAGKGWKPCMASEWEINDDRLKVAWQADVAGRLALGASATKSLVLMWREAEHFKKDQERRLRASNDIAKSAEEREAEIAGKLGRLGDDVSVSLTIEDDDGAPERPSKTPRKRR